MIALPNSGDATRNPAAAPLWFQIAAGFGLLWNIYGIVQFLSVVGKSEAHFVGMGMTAAQAALYAHLPFWMDGAFATGVFGGLMGSALLLFRKWHALPVLSASLGAYVVLYAGDIALGIFAAFGAAQVAILTFVVAVALGLLVMAIWAARRNILS